jgi:hypothetical protein
MTKQAKGEAMAKRPAPETLRLSRKTRVVKLKKDPSKTYPKNLTPMSASLKAVREAAIHLQGLGFTHVGALEVLAAQMHENLLAYSAYKAKKGGR